MKVIKLKKLLLLTNNSFFKLQKNKYMLQIKLFK